MNAVVPMTCLDLVHTACPFPLTRDLVRLANALCGAGWAPHKIAWLILLMTLQPRRSVKRSKQANAIPSLNPPPDFPWQLWEDFCIWATGQAPPLPLEILNDVLEKIVGKKFKTIAEAIEHANESRPHPTKAAAFKK